MSVRVCLPGAGGGCIGNATALPRPHTSGYGFFPVCKSSRVLRIRGQIWRNELRTPVARSLLPVHCVASDASSSSSSSGVESALVEENVAAVDVKASSDNVEVNDPSTDVKDSGGESGDAVESTGEKDGGLTDGEGDGDDTTEKEKEKKRTWEAMQNIQQRRIEDWKKADSFMQKNGIFQARIVGFNKGGLVLNFYSIRAFLPYSQLSLARLPRDSRTVMDVGKDLVGKVVPAMVIQADKKNRKLVFSERKALWNQYASKIQIGSVLEGTVTGIVDYGAFVDIRFPDGAYPAIGLVHVKEMSWDVVTNPRDVVSVGQDIKSKVIGIDNEAMRLALSMRQLEQDPLMETLDTLMPKEESPAESEANESEDELLNEPLPGIDDICKELKNEEGVTAVTLGRQKLEKHVVSQDLELWLSQAPEEDGRFTLLARAGRQVQEVHVTTSLDRDEMKVAVKRVTQKLP